MIATMRNGWRRCWRLMQTDLLAYELEDEKARQGYARILREIKRGIAEADE